MEKLIGVVLLFVALGSACAAEVVSLPASAGAVCAGEGTLSDLPGAQRLICANGHWRELKPKAPGSVAEEWFYEGRCSLRYEAGQSPSGKLVFRAEKIAEVCLPKGWRIKQVAVENSVNWVISTTPDIPNLVLIKGVEPGKEAKMWIYPQTPEGKPQDRIEVTWRTLKR